MPAPQIISELVERFKFNINDYKQGSYNETQVRREFIDPFFKALGWDISNEKGYAEAYKDVVHEYSLKTKDKAEAPDYLFRIGGTKKFFVEAKKPSVNLRDDISPAFQLRRYAWSAKLPLSILTDFEELVIYDCRIQPKKTDKSSTGRIKYFTYEEYIDKWDEIESIFSREAVLKGSFDKYAESNKGKRGTAEVDEAFLKEIENWREILARNIALRNENLSNRELNFAVQKTIDRIIFLRICEDRGIEDYGQIMNLQNGANVYQRLLQIFTRADEKYNSGLFHFEDEKNRNEEPDKITPAISIDDKVLKEIIKNLYYPDSPYEFSVLPSDILGHVYEQFLGKVIRLTAGHRAVIEEKPEVKKAGGVYYTPTYIVDYIVKNTLGKKLEEIEQKYNLSQRHSERSEESHLKPSVYSNNINKAIKTASKIKVLDPACGSGSFLIGAYQYLLDWHIKLYTVETQHVVSLRKDSPVYQTKDGEYRLTTTEKKRILLNNIYGVDIDSQAVEVTKLSLLLKVLEGETDESLFTQISLFRQRALPDLSSNIKCGNSLIGPDFYDQTELNLDEEERYRINVFDWNSEFNEIMKEGGFDVVIGNPP
ncbi:MAG TPA: restriction endonuclease subunit M, partial [Ignavibacteria bacterium]|nr:restriction endonuclease subunit M [Ignavibacteria bacterium]